MNIRFGLLHPQTLSLQEPAKPLNTVAFIDISNNAYLALDRQVQPVSSEGLRDGLKNEFRTTFLPVDPTIRTDRAKSVVNVTYGLDQEGTAYKVHTSMGGSHPRDVRRRDGQSLDQALQQHNPFQGMERFFVSGAAELHERGLVERANAEPFPQRVD